MAEITWELTEAIADTEEERRKLENELSTATLANDRAALDKLYPRFRWDPFKLLGFKDHEGVEYIRKLGLDTSEADKLFGPDWLDHDSDDIRREAYALLSDE